MSNATMMDNIPKGLRWSASKYKKALEKDTDGFVGVSQTSTKKGEPASTTYRFLSSASRLWESKNPEENQIIFNFEYRIAGLPEDVRASLEKTAGLGKLALDKIVKESMTKDNFQTTMKFKYDAFVHHIKNIDTNNSLELAQLFASHLNTESDVHTIAQDGIILPQRGSLRTLVFRYRKALDEGQVLDVSNFDEEKHTGAFKRCKPKDFNRDEPIFYDTGLALASSKIGPYKSAVAAIFGSDGLITYQSQIDAVEKAIGGDFSGLSITIPKKNLESKSKNKTTEKPTMGTPKARNVLKSKTETKVKTINPPAKSMGKFAASIAPRK
jgi:hypothetical protein